jgi:hypothetical protein
LDHCDSRRLLQSHRAIPFNVGEELPGRWFMCDEDGNLLGISRDEVEADQRSDAAAKYERRLIR